MKYILILLFSIISTLAFTQKTYLLAGTYTNGKSIGLYSYTFNPETGQANIQDSIQTKNPSYLTVSPNKKFVYAVNEINSHDTGGRVSAFAFDKSTGHFTFINQQPSNGDDPCYIITDQTGKWVIVGNYSSGTIAVLPVQKDGGLGAPVTTIRHTGKGPDQERQEKPHVHSTVLSSDNKYLFVADLGIDKEMIYSFNASTGTLKPATQPYAKLKDGAGPRHFIFHPSGKYAYLAQELTASVTAFKYANGKLTAIQTLGTLPKGYDGPKRTADIHVSPDGKFLYVSDRDESNTLAIFRIDQATGKLALVGHQSTLGKTPRNFNFDPSGNYLLVANQNTDDIVIFKVDHKTGLLTDTGNRLSIGNPVCIKWVTP